MLLIYGFLIWAVIYYAITVYSYRGVDYRHGLDELLDSQKMGDKRFRKRRALKFIVPILAGIFAGIVFLGKADDQGAIILAIGVASFIAGKIVEENVQNKD